MANRTVEINGAKYIKKNGKLYSMPRTVTNRKILRNRLKTFLKQRGYTNVNKLMKQCWQDKEVQKQLR